MKLAELGFRGSVRAQDDRSARRREQQRFCTKRVLVLRYAGLCAAAAPSTAANIRKLTSTFLRANLGVDEMGRTARKGKKRQSRCNRKNEERARQSNVELCFVRKACYANRQLHVVLAHAIYRLYTCELRRASAVHPR